MVEGHLGCLQFVTVKLLLGICPGVIQLCLQVELIPIFKKIKNKKNKNHQIDFQSSCMSYLLPLAMEKGFLCSKTSPICAFFEFFYLNHSEWFRVILICIFLMTKYVKHFFVSWPFEIPLLRIICLIIYHIFKNWII